MPGFGRFRNREQTPSEEQVPARVRGRVSEMDQRVDEAVGQSVQDFLKLPVQELVRTSYPVEDYLRKPVDYFLAAPALDAITPRRHSMHPIPQDIVEETALDLWRDGDIYSLADFEVCLRAMGSRVYCVSVPHHAVSSSEVAYYPDRADEPKYRLTIADGRRNAAGALQQWAMDARGKRQPPDRNRSAIDRALNRQVGAAGRTGHVTEMLL